MRFVLFLSLSLARPVQLLPSFETDLELSLCHFTFWQGYNSVYSTDSEEESERERLKKGTLGKLARRRFTSCLRGLKGERGDIARCMTFALEHADAADEVSCLEPLL